MLPEAGPVDRVLPREGPAVDPRAQRPLPRGDPRTGAGRLPRVSRRTGEAAERRPAHARAPQDCGRVRRGSRVHSEGGRRNRRDVRLSYPRPPIRRKWTGSRRISGRITPDSRASRSSDTRGTRRARLVSAIFGSVTAASKPIPSVWSETVTGCWVSSRLCRVNSFPTLALRSAQDGSLLSFSSYTHLYQTSRRCD